MGSEKSLSSGLGVCGLQSAFAYRYKVCKSTVSEIFSGRKRATVKQAADLEEFFLRRGIPINRWDLLYSVQRGQSLADYLAQKTNEENQVREEEEVMA